GCGGKKQEGAAAGGASSGTAPASGDAAPTVVDTMADDAMPVVVDAAAAPAPPDTFLVVTSAVVPGKLVATARGGAAALSALAGARVELRGDSGRVCEATVGAIVDGPRCVGRTPLVELVDHDAPCDDAFYAVAPGRALAATKVGKATPEIEAAATAYWDEGTGR